MADFLPGSSDDPEATPLYIGPRPAPAGGRPSFCLPEGAVLQGGRYVVGRVLGKPGGFGVTYLGLEVSLEVPVAVKEFFPRELAGRGPDGQTVRPRTEEDGPLFRSGLDRFIREAKTVAGVSHPHVVRVRSFFLENGTGYLVMDYYQGMTLDETLEKRGGKIPEAEAVAVMRPVLDALHAVHSTRARDPGEKGLPLLHRDVKPRNIYMVGGGGGPFPILLDFGSARYAAGGGQSLSLVLTPGYAPLEQYQEGAAQGPWTDVYSCAATLYRMVCGQAPPPAAARALSDPLSLRRGRVAGAGKRFSRAVVRGLALDPARRPQTAVAFRDLLAGAPSRGVRLLRRACRLAAAAALVAALVVAGAKLSGVGPAVPATVSGGSTSSRPQTAANTPQNIPAAKAPGVGVAGPAQRDAAPPPQGKREPPGGADEGGGPAATPVSGEARPPADGRGGSPPTREVERRKTCSVTVADRATTDLWVEKGERVQVRAGGVISFGPFSPSGGPEGVTGLFTKSYSIVRSARHGAPMAKTTGMGFSEWVEVQRGRTFVAAGPGYLELMVNDIKTEDNSGSFDVDANVLE